MWENALFGVYSYINEIHPKWGCSFSPYPYYRKSKSYVKDEVRMTASLLFFMFSA